MARSRCGDAERDERKEPLPWHGFFRAHLAPLLYSQS
jgi:hypothetical protein